MRRLSVAAVLGALALTLSACAPTLPPYDEVKSETEEAMQLIVETLPPGTPLEDRSGEPFACQLDGGGGIFFTGLWTLSPGADFDGKAYIEELPSELADEFTVDESAIEVSFPAVSLRPKSAPGVVVDVTTNVDGEEPFVDIRAISRCAASPEG